MKVAIAADHGGFPMKADLAALIISMDHEVIDLGAHQDEPTDDYPDYARYIGQAIQNNHAQRGVLLCGSGVVQAWLPISSKAFVRVCVMIRTVLTRVWSMMTLMFYVWVHVLSVSL